MVKIIPSSETGAKSLEKLKAELHQGSQAIAARQKLIKVADRSDYVWAVVEAVEGEHNAQHISMLIQKDLQNTGFITNLEKSNWVPRKHATWLGFDIRKFRISSINSPQM